MWEVALEDSVFKQLSDTQGAVETRRLTKLMLAHHLATACFTQLHCPLRLVVVESWPFRMEENIQPHGRST